ncbi:MAG TPA: DUF6351 family protein, partial [Jatrophihabitantaceae bacterium]|nr:DUF6351 family protein [Jatrophihabitantaceae bacterium]
MRTWHRTAVVAAAAALVAGMTAAGPTPVPASAGGPLQITSVSNPRPGLVSGGQVLVRVTPPAGTDAAAVRVSANGVDVTPGFAAQPGGGLLGLVSGLRDGENILAARVVGHGTDGGLSATLLVTNHPITGPVFSGAQQLPFFCETQVFGL